MTTQSEYILEENLINQLVELGYSKVTIQDEVRPHPKPQNPTRKA